MSSYRKWKHLFFCNYLHLIEGLSSRSVGGGARCPSARQEVQIIIGLNHQFLLFFERFSAHLIYLSCESKLLILAFILYRVQGPKLIGSQGPGSKVFQLQVKSPDQRDILGIQHVQKDQLELINLLFRGCSC